jgi:hypothetical protein
MSAAPVQARQSNGLALLLTAAALLVAASGVVYYLLQTRPVVAAAALPVDALVGLALDASGAVAGDTAALAGFQQRQKQLEDAAAQRRPLPRTRVSRAS